MTGLVTALGQFIQILIGGIVDLAKGIAEGVATMASSLLLEVNATTNAVEGLSVFGGIVALFAGIALAITLTTRVYLWITSLGKN